MNWGELAKDIAAAARSSFSELLAQHRDETFYAFALYTDEDCYTIEPAANSLEQYHGKMSRKGKADPQSLAYYRWASAEWAYESFAASPFDAICLKLSAASDEVSGDMTAFGAFKTDVQRAMIEGLKLLAADGFFDQLRARAVLFITSSDHDEAKEMEDGSARILNPPEVYELFHRRYQATI